MNPLALTLGDPSGIGPELCLRLLAEEKYPIQIFGSAALLQRCAEHTGLPFSEKNITDIPFPEAQEIIPGEISAASGQHSFQCLEKATESVIGGHHSALVTNPIHKEAWHLAGHHYPGHTEYLVEKTKAEKHAMMLTSGDITCALVTTHIPLSEVSTTLTTARILEVIRLTHEAMTLIRGADARLTLPGLNPHAGEGGLFGNEEATLIQPALDQARAEGIPITGPLPSDTAFVPSIRTQTDAYICLYHDQGLIPLKTLAFDHAVNTTLGLPIVRTSVDHGTAHDIAWQNLASPTSLIEAVKLAQKMTSSKK